MDEIKPRRGRPRKASSQPVIDAEIKPPVVEEESPIAMADYEPDMMYICPGPHRGPHGLCYQFSAVSSKAQELALEAKGYRWTIKDAAECSDDPFMPVKKVKKKLRR